ncbi:hypothetical protein D3C80_1617310 [compost metagenome]
MVLRMGQQIRKLPIIRQQQKSFCVIVQAAHRVYPLLDPLQIIRYYLAALVIGCACNDTLGLVEHNVDFIFAPDQFSGHLNNILFGVHFRAKRSYELPVDLHFTGQNHFFTLASGRNTCLRQNFL